MAIRVSAIIVAAGEGVRVSAPPAIAVRRTGDVPKPYIKLNGTPIIALTLKPFDETDIIDNIVVVAHPSWVNYCKSEIIEKFGFKKVTTVINGGVKRQDSVNAGLGVVVHHDPSGLSPSGRSLHHGVDTSLVLIHDCARPFITQELIIRLIKAGKKYGAVVPGIPVTDTIKEVQGSFVGHTIQREQVYSIQTPQVFRLNVIKEAYKEAYDSGFYGTDDSSLVERIGFKVRVIQGSKENIKITTQEDLVCAEAIIEMQKLRIKNPKSDPELVSGRNPKQIPNPKSQCSQ